MLRRCWLSWDFKHFFPFSLWLGLILFLDTFILQNIGLYLFFTNQICPMNFAKFQTFISHVFVADSMCMFSFPKIIEAYFKMGELCNHFFHIFVDKPHQHLESSLILHKPPSLDCSNTSAVVRAKIEGLVHQQPWFHLRKTPPKNLPSRFSTFLV